MPLPLKPHTDSPFSAKVSKESTKLMLTPAKPTRPESTNSPIWLNTNSLTRSWWKNSPNLIITPLLEPMLTLRLLIPSIGDRKEQSLPSRTKDHVDHAGHSPLPESSKVLSSSKRDLSKASPNNSWSIAVVLMASNAKDALVLGLNGLWTGLRPRVSPLRINILMSELTNHALLILETTKSLHTLKLPPTMKPQLSLLPMFNPFLFASMLPLGSTIPAVSSMIAMLLPDLITLSFWSVTTPTRNSTLSRTHGTPPGENKDTSDYPRTSMLADWPCTPSLLNSERLDFEFNNKKHTF